MLHLIPAPLHRTGLRIAHGLRKLWWRWRHPRVIGCRVLAFDAQGCVLLIRHSYGSGRWLPPGGGMARGEDPVAAARRELREEAGCALEDTIEVAMVEEDLHGAVNQVHVVAGRLSGEAHADRREVIAARCFPLDALPADMPAPLRQQLPGWAEAFNRAPTRS